MEYSIRAASVEDCKDIRRLIGELAEYEKVADEVTITQRDLEQDGFSENPFFHCIIAEVPERHKTKEGHTKIGYATYFYNYNTWCGRAIYMGDLYVTPEFRGKGIGRALMSKVAQLGRAAGSTSPSWTGTNPLRASISDRAASISQRTRANTSCAAREKRSSTWPNRDPALWPMMV